MVMPHMKECDGVYFQSQGEYLRGMVTHGTKAYDSRPEGERVPAAFGFATVLEAANFLRLSRAKIHLMLRAGEIPHTRYGRAVRIPWTWLRAQAEAQ